MEGQPKAYLIHIMHVRPKNKMDTQKATLLSHL